MPIIQSAKKKMRQDKRRTKRNKPVRTQVKTAVKDARVKPSKRTLQEAFSALDIAAKKHILHKNKAARLKSRLSKLTEQK